MNLKFTVVTVVFNGEKVIRKTIESVLNQEYAPYEYIEDLLTFINKASKLNDKSTNTTPSLSKMTAFK